MPGGVSQGERWLIEQWASGLSKAIASIMGDAPRVVPDESLHDAPQDSGAHWWTQPYSPSPDAKIWVGAPVAAWRGIGNEVLKSAGIEDGDDENIKSTYLEILGQSLSGVAQALSGRIHREVACAGGIETSEHPDRGFEVKISLGDQELTLFAAFSSEVVELWASAEAATEIAPPAKVEEQSPASVPAAGKAYPKGLDLLLDVELPVSVSFGRTQLAIKDVIKLTTGSIVELNRSIAEPVDVIVNNVVIARGEVVVVEGNFGVRIKQVISRQERLRTVR